MFLAMNLADDARAQYGGTDTPTPEPLCTGTPFCIEKSAEVPTYCAGDQVHWTISWCNNSGETIQAHMFDPIPAGLSNLYVVPSPIRIDTTIEWDLGGFAGVANGACGELNWFANVDDTVASGTVMNNQAEAQRTDMAGFDVFSNTASITIDPDGTCPPPPPPLAPLCGGEIDNFEDGDLFSLQARPWDDITECASGGSTVSNFSNVADGANGTALLVGVLVGNGV